VIGGNADVCRAIVDQLSNSREHAGYRAVRRISLLEAADAEETRSPGVKGRKATDSAPADSSGKLPLDM